MVPFPERQNHAPQEPAQIPEAADSSSDGKPRPRKVRQKNLGNSQLTYFLWTKSWPPFLKMSLVVVVVSNI